MDIQKQSLILSILVNNRNILATCNGILRPSYFDASLRKPAKFVKDYFEKYKEPPNSKVIRAETGFICDDIGQITSAEQKYICDEIESFCKNNAMTEAILKGPELIEKGDFGKILTLLKDAVSVGLNKDLGMNYFKNVESRLEETLVAEAKISTGWAELDDLIGGGLNRQELIVFAANSGGGKSMTMLNLAKNLLKQSLNGVYISLEMAEGSISKRLDSMISLISQYDLLKQIKKVSSLVEKASANMGTFIVKRMPENRTNINTIRSYLTQLEQSTGFKPDFIIIDYIDIMGTTMNISLDNLFIKDKYVTEEIRSLGFDFNCIMISASQLGRTAVEAEKLNQSHIQGGMSKINTSDYTIGIRQDENMRAAGEIYFEVLKTRNSGGAGQRKLLSWDPVSLNIISLDNKNKQLHLNNTKDIPKIAAVNSFFNKNDENATVLGLMNT